MYKQHTRFVFFQKGSQSLSCAGAEVGVSGVAPENSSEFFPSGSKIICVYIEFLFSFLRDLRIYLFKCARLVVEALSHLHFEGIFRYSRSSILIGNALMVNLYNSMRRMMRLVHGENLMKII